MAIASDKRRTAPLRTLISPVTPSNEAPMFLTGRRLGHIASRFHVAPSHLRRSHKQSIQSHDATQETSFTIQLIVPPSTQPERVEFSGTIPLANFVTRYQ